MTKISVDGLCNSLGMPCVVLGAANNKTSISRPAAIDSARKDSISFCSSKSEVALDSIKKSKAKVIICSNELAFTPEDYCDKILIVVSNPRLAFIRVMREYFAVKVERGIHASAVVHAKAKVGSNVYIGPHCYIGKCQIGKGTIIYGNVSIYDGVRIGCDVIIGAGTVIGADGFSLERNTKNELERFPHIGGVIIRDDVEIGTNVSIDRGTMGDTIIGKGTMIDNLCHIAHNVVVGRHCVIIAQSMLGGSAQIGDYSWIAPCVCIRDGIKLGKNVTVGMGAVVTKSIAGNRTVFGVPAKEYQKDMEFRLKRNIRE